MRVLLVEDERVLRESLSVQLRRRGYVVETALDGEEGLYWGKEYSFDAAIIDIGLPKIGGIELIQALRQSHNTCPILILTARSQWQDKVNGLEAGADDYLTKPFQFEELNARLNALIRRQSGWTSSLLSYGTIEMDSLKQTVCVDHEPILLTAFEYRILEYLMHHAGDVVSKTKLTEHVYQEDCDRDSNVLEVLVARLRRKLDPNDSFQPIETLRGRGYRLNKGP